MKIEFVDGEKVVTHDSGVIVTYSIKGLKNQKDSVQKQIDSLIEQIAEIDKDIEQCKKSQ